MARTLEEFPGTARAPYSKYDWASWADGQVWQLVAGEDYTTDTERVRTAAANYAARKGLSVRTSKLVEDGTETLVVQFTANGVEADAA